MKFYLVTVGTMYVQGFKMDPNNEPLYAKLTPLANYARVITDLDLAQTLASYINGSVIAFEENEKEEI